MVSHNAIELDEDTVADFRAEVGLGGSEEPPRRMRVVLGTDRLVFVDEDSKRTVALSTVFDIVRDVSSRAAAEASETVTVAFRVGERRETASMAANAETLLQFQRVLFRTLLDGTPVTVRQAKGGPQALQSPTELSLAATASRVHLRDGSGETVLAIPRDAITEFKTGEGSPGASEPPVVSLYWLDGDRPVKTAVRLPSARLFNLFGRYIQSTLRLESAETGTRSGPVEILLVDDDPDDLELCELFLRRQSDRFAITTASSAAVGLDYLAGDDPVDCVVSDFEMPGMDGLGFLNAVRDDHPDLPYILFTGEGSEEVTKRAIIDDVTDYVEKDIGTDQYTVLAERIWRAVR